jgi:fructose-1-phosphate kinase PfkB-like protein
MGIEVSRRLNHPGDDEIQIGTIGVIGDSNRFITQHFNPPQMLGRHQGAVAEKSMGVKINHNKTPEYW